MMAATNRARSLSSSSRALNLTANSNLGSMISLKGFLKLLRNSLVTKPLPLATSSPSLFIKEGSMAKIASCTPYFSKVTCGEGRHKCNEGDTSVERSGDRDAPGHWGTGPQSPEYTWQTPSAPVRSPPWCTGSGKKRGPRFPWWGERREVAGSTPGRSLPSRACPRRRWRRAETSKRLRDKNPGVQV